MRELYDRGGPSPEEVREAADFLILFGEAGAVTEFTRPDRRVGRTPDLFNKLAAALAALAWSPGGISLFGITWDIKRTHLPPPTA